MTMTILITGAAGFIGFHVAQALLGQNYDVVGIDNLNDYYDVQLKHDRLEILKAQSNFIFEKIDIADRVATEQLFDAHDFDIVIHLAAQAGVRYSLENPHAYIDSNIVGQLNILEGVRHSKRIKRLIYASSSSVYGGNDKQPFSEGDRVDNPVSLYAATKKADELMAHTYAHLYGMECVGLRFFTVYGPYGRPDMAYFSFTDKMMRGEAIPVYNHGNMKRDFTFIDDVVKGVCSSIDAPIDWGDEAKHIIFNLGNNQTETLMDFIKTIEGAIGVSAKKDMLPMQPGDVAKTWADITQAQKQLNYKPTTPISEGIPKFIEWYKRYYKK